MLEPYPPLSPKFSSESRRSYSHLQSSMCHKFRERVE